MNLKPLKLSPVLITVCVIILVALVRLLNLGAFDRLERMTYDWRVRAALHFPQPAATNLGAVFISDDSITALNNGSLGFRHGLYWPRQIYGRVLRELAAQDARVVAYDIMFGELRPDHGAVPVATARQPEITQFLRSLHPKQEPATYQDRGEELTLVDSDDYFAWQLHRSGRAVLAGERGIPPQPLFATNALMLGDISADRDADGVLRRAKAFKTYRYWHPLIKQAAREQGLNLDDLLVERDRIILPLKDGQTLEIPLDPDGNIALKQRRDSRTPAAKTKPFTDKRVWHMGIVLAARELNLDLANAQMDLAHGRITFRGGNGVERILPVDADGYFYINWELVTNDPRLTQDSFESLLKQDLARTAGQTNDLINLWKDKLVIIGSSATGNDLTDRGATPLEKDTFLVSKHWNVANSLITGRFVRHASMPVELLLIALLATVTALLTWHLRVLTAAGAVILLVVAYCALGLWLYVAYRYWLPLVLPVLGAMLLNYVGLVSYRVVFEQRERRRVKSVFSKIVSPDVVNELLGAKSLSPLGGARREITVLFADVRGFTELTDTMQEQVTSYVESRQLTGEAAEVHFNESARETLNTVNLYLSIVADMVKRHNGTLDKYIGDCVMAFWGAPTPNPDHALACVRAAIDAQRAIDDLNRQRVVENRQRSVENSARLSAGLPPKPPLPTLALGTGINTGIMTVGLMGSDAHILNYTVFGREVNLASRLEGVSGRGRIIIGEATYKIIQTSDPALAATCVEQEPTKPKGFQKAVRNFEVPWQNVVAASVSSANR